MSSRKQPPSITQSDFDAIVSQLTEALRHWYEERKSNPDAPPLNPVTAGAFDYIPDIDSKAVVTASEVIKRFLGVKLDPRLIRKGGYTSFDDLLLDLLPKLRELCPASIADVSQPAPP